MQAKIRMLKNRRGWRSTGEALQWPLRYDDDDGYLHLPFISLHQHFPFFRRSCIAHASMFTQRYKVLKHAIMVDRMKTAIYDTKYRENMTPLTNLMGKAG